MGDFQCHVAIQTRVASVENDTSTAATQFTLYMATANLGYALGAKLITWFGLAGLDLSLADFYMLAGLSPLIPLVLLVGLDPDGVEERRLAEALQLEMAKAE